MVRSAPLPRPPQVCTHGDMPASVREALQRRHQPPGGAAQRFFSTPTQWTGAAQQTLPGASSPASLTFSFPSDGVLWGNVLPEIPLGPQQPNDLNVHLRTRFGSLDLGRELIRQAMAAWTVESGLELREVADDDTPADADIARWPTRGDLRIGGAPYGDFSFLAFNFFPAEGGDMTINTSFFPAEANFYSDPWQSYRFLRNTAAHEAGHGLGYFHPVPCSGEKLMEPLISVANDALTIDETRGAAFHYGDRYAGNQSMSAAADLGAIGAGGHDVRARSLALNVLNGDELDYFVAHTASAGQAKIRVTPVAGVYFNDVQVFGCGNYNPFGEDPIDPNDDEFFKGYPAIDIARVATIAIERLDAVGNVIATAGQPGAGEPAELVAFLDGGETLRFRVRGAATDLSPVYGWVQLYTLTIDAPNAAPPRPRSIAGLDKRVAIGRAAHFIGDLLSHAAAPGARIVRYDWDLDGDGVFEVLDNPRPSRVFTEAGVSIATLRVTDSNGQQGLDTIQVTAAAPQQHASTPIRILNQFTASGLNRNQILWQQAIRRFRTVPRGERVGFTLLSNDLGAGGATIANFALDPPAGVALHGTLEIREDTGVLGLSADVAADAPLGVRRLLYTPPGGGPVRVFEEFIEVIPELRIAEITSFEPNVFVAGTTPTLTIRGVNFDRLAPGNNLFVLAALRFQFSQIGFVEPFIDLPAADPNGLYTISGLMLDVPASEYSRSLLLAMPSVGGVVDGFELPPFTGTFAGRAKVVNTNPPPDRLQQITPTVFVRGTTTPVTLSGVGLPPANPDLSVLSHRSFRVTPAPSSPAEFILIGEPQTSPDGTTITGLSLVVGEAEPAGVRTVIYDDPIDGPFALVDAIEITGAPSACAGDADCDGDVDFFDIDPFVAKLGCPASDPAACGAGCPWENADIDGDGDVDFFDIDPLVGRLGAICP